MINFAYAIEQAHAMNGSPIPMKSLGVIGIIFLVGLAILIFLISLLMRNIKNPRQKVATDHMVKKNPGVAAVISLFISGGGQIYNGEIKNGIIYIILFALFFFILIGVIFDSNADGIIFLPALFLFGTSISSIHDAYKSAIKINKAIDELKLSTMKKCSFCAEHIKDEAIICRFCGKEAEQQA